MPMKGQNDQTQPRLFGQRSPRQSRSMNLFDSRSPRLSDIEGLPLPVPNPPPAPCLPAPQSRCTFLATTHFRRRNSLPFIVHRMRPCVGGVFATTHLAPMSANRSLPFPPTSIVTGIRGCRLNIDHPLTHIDDPLDQMRDPLDHMRDPLGHMPTLFAHGKW